MNIIDREPQGQKETDCARTTSNTLLYRNIYIGIILIVAGVLWMLKNLDVIDHRVFGIIFSWQMMLIVMGGYLMTLRKLTAGGILLAVGVAFAVGDWFDLPLPIRDIILPLIVIVLGVCYLFQKR